MRRTQESLGQIVVGSIAGLAVVAALAWAAGFFEVRAQSALADVTPAARLSAQAVIDHGDWQRLPDAGFRYNVCGYTLTTAGAKVYFTDVPGQEPIGPCEFCEPGAWAGAPAFCVAQWKTNRGL